MRADDEGWSETRIGYAAAAGWLAGWCASLWLGVRDEVVLRVPAGISIKGGRRRHWTVPRSLSGARREGKRASSSLWIYPAAEYRSPIMRRNLQTGKQPTRNHSGSVTRGRQCLTGGASSDPEGS